MTRIFISYKRENQPFAEVLRQRLLDWGYETWMDKEDILLGVSWADGIHEGMKASDIVIGIMTPLALKSPRVREEWNWAIINERRLILLMLEKSEMEDIPPLYITINWLDCTHGHELCFDGLQKALKSPEPAPLFDPYRDYLKQLAKRITEKYLKPAIVRLNDDDIPEPIQLMIETKSDAVDEPEDPFIAINRGVKEAPKPFSDFAAAYEYYDGRVLLLGDPGAGKTITLWQFALSAIAWRTKDSTQPLPILASIPTWDIRTAPPLIDWLSASYGAPPNTADIIQQGKALLLLDGLDELGGEREDPTTKERIPDPRPRFMDALRALPESNCVIVTCRVKDYEEIGQKIALKGALTLRALNDAQIRDYLRDLPELWDALQVDEQLRNVTRTPILLSYFAFGYKEASAEERQKRRDLRNSASDLRDAIFERYVIGRYEHESRKMKARGGVIPFTLRQLIAVLGWIALGKTMYSADETVLSKSDFELNLGTPENAAKFTALAMSLNLLVPSENEDFRFIHLLMRDHFAFKVGIAALHFEEADARSSAATWLGWLGDKRAIESLIPLLRDLNDDVKESVVGALVNLKALQAIIEPLINLLTDDHYRVRASAASALGELGDARAVEPLIAALHDSSAFVRTEIVSALGELGDARAVEPLITALKDKDHYVYENAAYALGKLREAHAVEPLIGILLDPDSRLRHNLCDTAATALENIGTPEALKAAQTWRSEQAKHYRYFRSDGTI